MRSPMFPRNAETAFPHLQKLIFARLSDPTGDAGWVRRSAQPPGLVSDMILVCDRWVTLR